MRTRLKMNITCAKINGKTQNKVYHRCINKKKKNKNKKRHEHNNSKRAQKQQTNRAKHVRHDKRLHLGVWKKKNPRQASELAAMRMKIIILRFLQHRYERALQYSKAANCGKSCNVRVPVVPAASALSAHPCRTFGGKHIGALPGLLIHSSRFRQL